MDPIPLIIATLLATTLSPWSPLYDGSASPLHPAIHRSFVPLRCCYKILTIRHGILLCSNRSRLCRPLHTKSLPCLYNCPANTNDFLNYIERCQFQVHVPYAGEVYIFSWFMHFYHPCLMYLLGFIPWSRIRSSLFKIEYTYNISMVFCYYLLSCLIDKYTNHNKYEYIELCVSVNNWALNKNAFLAVRIGCNF